MNAESEMCTEKGCAEPGIVDLLIVDIKTQTKFPAIHFKPVTSVPYKLN